MHHQVHQGHEGVPAALDHVARHVVDAGLKVHRALGPGLLESAYEACLVHELVQRGIAVQRQVDGVIVEVKAVEALSRLHEAQILTYLKLSRRRLSFLMNFNTCLFKDGVRRLAL